MFAAQPYSAGPGGATLAGTAPWWQRPGSGPSGIPTAQGPANRPTMRASSGPSIVPVIRTTYTPFGSHIRVEYATGEVGVVPNPKFRPFWKHGAFQAVAIGFAGGWLLGKFVFASKWWGMRALGKAVSAYSATKTVGTVASSVYGAVVMGAELSWERIGLGVLGGFAFSAGVDVGTGPLGLPFGLEAPPDPGGTPYQQLTYALEQLQPGSEAWHRTRTFQQRHYEATRRKYGGSRWRKLFDLPLEK